MGADEHMKIVRAVLIFTFLLGGAIGCCDASNVQGDQQESLAASFQAEHEVITNLSLALVSSGQVARIFFHGTCRIEHGENVLFPVLHVHSPTKGQSGLHAVREIFRDNPNVAVSQDSSGIIRIWIGKLSTTILDGNLSSLKLSQDAQYNPDGPDGAIYTIEHTEEARAAMAKLKIRQAIMLYIGGSEPALEKLPHLVPLITNNTIQQTLDTIAKTFRGAVTYGECQLPDGENLIDIEFVGFPGVSSKN